MQVHIFNARDSTLKNSEILNFIVYRFSLLVMRVNDGWDYIRTQTRLRPFEIETDEDIYLIYIEIYLPIFF